MKINLYQNCWNCFVRNIVELRKYYEIPKNKFAKILGIDIATLRRIESGELPENITVEIFLKAEKYFGIPVNDLITYFIFD